MAKEDPLRLKRPWLTVVSALGAGMLIVVAVVWPAEYGLDPLGTGELFGLVYMGEDTTSPLIDQPPGYRVDAVAFVLEPFQSVEYKYQLARDATLVFEWHADGEVVSDLHAEPAIGPPGYAETFDLRRDENVAGSYTATFNGIHGWFWENRGQETVEVRLTTAGFYQRAFEFRDGDKLEYGDFPEP
ncbi:MAG: hypothetical protein QF515_04845 [Pseudomonadales bacterium]|nr:hypothetical protein [Pseudomonadales bacterium]MDP6826428.1 hypothetical protein [Pseudomonadales bacterium]